MSTAVQRYRTVLLETIHLILDINQSLYSKGYSTIDPSCNGLVIAIINDMDPIFLVESFIERTYNIWDLVKKRDVAFFLDNADVILSELQRFGVPDVLKKCFNGLDSSGNPLVSEYDKEDMWIFFEALIRTTCDAVLEQRRLDPSAFTYYPKIEHYRELFKK